MALFPGLHVSNFILARRNLTQVNFLVIWHVSNSGKQFEGFFLWKILFCEVAYLELSVTGCGTWTERFLSVWPFGLLFSSFGHLVTFHKFYLNALRASIVIKMINFEMLSAKIGKLLESLINHFWNGPFLVPFSLYSSFEYSWE